MMRRLTKEQIKKVKELDILTFFKNYRPDAGGLITVSEVEQLWTF